MQAKLHHRGPDDHGLYLSTHRHCALAHTRLAILDPTTAGRQPMTTADRRYTLILNGEIYNFPELRCELEQAGVRFRSRSDTEVVLQLIARDGWPCVARLRGMFALSLWDDVEQRLTLARDRQGIKPLYYFQNHEMFLCASEVRALLASGQVPRRSCRAGLTDYLQFGSVQDPLTLVDGVKALRPGQIMIVEAAANRISTMEHTVGGLDEDFSERFSGDRQAAVGQLRDALSDSVRRHLISDVPLGVFLSGGIDSSAIVALLRQVSRATPKTFSVVCTDDEYSEAEHARSVAHHFATDHCEFKLTDAELVALLPSALAAMDQPTMDGINTYVIANTVRQAGVTVALSGLGGDELFAGYPSFRRAVQLRRLAMLPLSVRHSAAALGRRLAGSSTRREKFWDLLASEGRAQNAYQISRRLFSPAEVQRLLPGAAPADIMRCAERDRDVVNHVSLLESRGYMTNTLLRDTDQMSMAHGLEVRVPFVDTEVEKLVHRLPGAWKLDRCRPKPLLLDALGGMIPEAVWRRPKMGFTLPFQRWMLSALRAEIDATFSTAAALENIGVKTHAAQSVWREFIAAPAAVPWSRPWTLHVLARWCTTHGMTR